ncbi:hypothetical protein CHH80_10610 [Bacillus sp. 7504-2]|nr:hypothetical protein CHH80_10610 [Bacillus sp. 7504-2]
MTEQFMFYIDVNRCINCKSCEMACNEYYGLTDIHRRNVVTIDMKNSTNTISVSLSCGHCSNPLCIYVCPENNFYKRHDGIVVHNSTHCKSCTRCITTCPFQAPKLNPKTNRADKCNFCVERIDEGLKPICVEACVTGALNIVKMNPDTVNATLLIQSGFPLASYTKPSIFIKEKQNGIVFLREGC